MTISRDPEQVVKQTVVFRVTLCILMRLDSFYQPEDSTP
jgi:hypothetical protein